MALPVTRLVFLAGISSLVTLVVASGKLIQLHQCCTVLHDFGIRKLSLFASLLIEYLQVSGVSLEPSVEEISSLWLIMGF